MVFAYYSRLTRSQQRIYRQSDEIGSILLPYAAALAPLVEQLADALKREERRRIEAVSRELASALTARLKVSPV